VAGSAACVASGEANRRRPVSRIATIDEIRCRGAAGRACGRAPVPARKVGPGPADDPGGFINRDDAPRPAAAHTAREEPPMTEPTPLPADAPVRVLVVDDHALLADALCLELADAGFEARAVGGPTAAAILAVASEHQPQVVLLDLDLGEAVGSGRDLVAGLAAGGAAVVVLTGSTDELAHAACLEAGAVGVVSKAEPLAHLCVCVAAAAEGQPLTPVTRRAELLARLQAARADQRRRTERFRTLTPREQAVLGGLMEGRSAAEIAAAAYVSLATVRSQIRSILTKLGVGSQLEAVSAAHRAGWRPEVEPVTGRRTG
jgi:DNA-binding NarL/FixJ family response regulator